MIDCHCHLADKRFDEDISQVIERARQNGVNGALVVAEFADDFERILALAQQFPDFILPCLGMHPVQRGFVSCSETLYKKDAVEEWIRAHSDKLYAVGEVGLDFKPQHVKNGDIDKEEQRKVLRAQIELANELHLPLNVHSRSAGTPAIDWLVAHGARAVLLHAFSGNVKSARNGIKNGFYFSIPPSFTLSEQKVALIREIPLSQLCLESDSPVLGPVPGERNEPKNIKLSAEFIARIKDVSLDEVMRATTANAKRLFSKLTFYPFQDASTLDNKNCILYSRRPSL
uniref:Deoxyribonuclease TATDN3 n=1 Tax=Globodera rostochiensis TaxID=31243 RepID=A0A914GSV8_GLORO